MNLLLKSSAFGLLIFALCFLLRVAFVLYLGVGYEALTSDGANTHDLSSQLLQAFFNGFLYDSRIIAVSVILYFVFGLFDVALNKIRKKDNYILAQSCAYFLFALLLFINIANMTYYTIYKDVFNIILLGIFFDDQKAILEDGLSGKYFLSVKFLFFFFALGLCIWLYKRFITPLSFKPKLSSKSLLLTTLGSFIPFALCVTFLFNSAFSLKEVSLDQEVQPVKNLFLQKITPSPFRSLYGVYEGYKASENSSFGSFISSTPYEGALDFFAITPPPTEELDLKDLLSHTSTKAPQTQPIRHIFYIVAESLGSFAFDEKYDEIGLVSGMKSLVDNQKGFMIPSFFENAHETIWSIETQIAGLYYTGVRLSFQSARLKELPTAIASNMRRAGYRTQFYYGGSQSWQNLGNYARSQGFEKVNGLGELEEFALREKYPLPYKNVWGVWDGILLDFVAQNNASIKESSFHMILTTSFHGPMNLPWEYIQKEGGDKERFEKFASKISSPKWEALELGTLWWIDKKITSFIHRVSEQYPDSLFVITGDHTHYGYTQGVLSNREVPMIIYSPTLKIYPTSSAGSQLDIAPTLLNLSAPKGFVYYSFGEPLFSTTPSKLSQKRIYNAFELVGNECEVYTQHKDRITLPQKQISQAQDSEFEPFLRRLKEGRALSWYLFSKGCKIKK